MQIRVDVYSADGVKQGEGPITTVTRASVTRLLDGAGSVSINLPAHDARGVGLLVNEARVRIYCDQFNRGLREVGRGIIRKVGYQASESGWEMTASGPDVLDELKRWSTNYNRAYVDMPVREIVADLISLVPGWSVECDVTTRYSGRFDAVSVLKAIQALVEKFGLHLRVKLGVDTNVLEVGAFGESAGLRLVNPKGMPQGFYANDQVAAIQSIQEQAVSEAVANRLYGLGAGANVDSALTLAMATRTDPPVMSKVVNGRVVYYLEDAQSIALYGVIEKDGQFKDVGPLENSDTFEQYAADALHDVMTTWLARYAVAQHTYGATVRKAVRSLSQGDKVTVDYIDTVEQAGAIIPIKRIVGDFWLMKVSENFSVEGVTQELQLSDIDRYQDSAGKVVLGRLESIELAGTTIQPSVNHYTYGPEQVELDNGVSATVQLIVTDAVSAIDRVLMRVRTRPFTSTMRGAAAGGDHRHLLATYAGSTSTTPPFLYSEYTFAAASGGGSKTFRVGSSSDDIWTQGASGTHVHDPEYGIYKDTQRPVNLTITVNGQVVISGIGTNGADLDVTIPITEQVRDKSGGFRAVHDVGISCASGQGEVVVSFDVVEQITPFRFNP